MMTSTHTTIMQIAAIAYSVELLTERLSVESMSNLLLSQRNDNFYVSLFDFRDDALSDAINIGIAQRHRIAIGERGPI